MLQYLDIYRAILRTYGFRWRPLGTFCLSQIRRLVDASTRGLDHLLAPGFRRQSLDRPVFILGNPRTGTTFLHRFLLESDRLCAFALWEALFPAITARRLLGGLIHRFAPFSPARYHSSEAHETSLRDVETDDLLEFFHFMEGGFVWSYYTAWVDEWGSPRSRRIFYPDDAPPREQERYFRFLEACWRRNLHLKRRGRLVAKASTLTLRVRTLLRRYPDCKLIYVVRDPVETVPSGLSLVTGVQERAYDLFHATQEAQRRRYLENLYQASCHLFRYFHEVWRAGEIPEDRLRIVPYPQLMTDLEGSMADLVSFLEIDPPPAFWDRVREQGARQRARESQHRYSPEKFGLTAERIASDLAFVYDDYGLDRPGP